jgi:hypothetical protein
MELHVLRETVIRPTAMLVTCRQGRKKVFGKLLDAPLTNMHTGQNYAR